MGRLVFQHIQNGLVTTSLLCLVGIASLFPRLVAQEIPRPLVQVFSAADMGSDASSFVIRQDPDGVLYFGADSLVIFDGIRWSQSPANKANAIRGLDFGANGKLWTAAHNEIGWYAKAPDNSWAYHSLLNKLPPEQAKLGETWNVFAEGNGAVFVSAEKILRWDGTAFRSWSLPSSRHLESIRSGAEIYVHHSPTGLYVLEPEGPRLIIPKSILGRAMVMWLERGPQGFVLATSRGLFRFIDDQLVPYAPEASEYVLRNRLTCATRLPDGRLALGTYQGGIVILTKAGNIDRILTEKDALPTDSILSLFVDREQGLWATSDFSVFRLTLDSNSTILRQTADYKNQPITKIARDQNQINVATVASMVAIDAATGQFHLPEFSFLNIADLQSTPRGLLVAALGGVKRIAAGKIESVFSIQQNTYAVKASSHWPGGFLVSDDNNLSLVDSEGQVKILVQNLPDIVRSIAEDAQGRLWMGTYAKGILVATPNETAPVDSVSANLAYGLPDSAGESRVTATTDGSILVFSSSGGWLLNPKANQFVAIDNFPAWSVNAVSDVLTDGSLWIVHPGTETRAASVARISVQGGHALWQPHSVDGLWEIGLPQCIFAETVANSETHLWIGGTNGLLRNVVARGPLAPTPRAPLLRTLARSAKAETLQGVTLPLPYSTRAIVFDFAAPEFAHRPALHLETMLDGVDQSWVPTSTSTRRELTALRDGRYTFRVRVVAETGVSGPASVSHFEINPPWWRTGTAILAALLALIPSSYGLYRWRVRLLRQHNAALEQKVLERTAQLERASAAKTQFVANMSHDIRNPLNGIVGLALALEDTWLDAKQRELVFTLRECTTYLSTLVDDVLDFATIEAGRVELRPGPFSPAELLRSIAAMFKMDAIASGAVLHVEADSKLPAAYIGDAGRIQQILVNYVSNALKYSGGPVTLTASIPADAPEEIEFSVSDEGPGISEEGQRALFTKFSRLTDAQSKEITGTGLGLASCRLLAGLMCGSVGVRSSPGHGARFFLRLPLDVFPLPTADSATASGKVPIVPDCTVLLVEDTNYNAMAATAVLNKFGLPCERACTGAEAVRLFAAKRHNLILLDRNLPDMDGTEVARQIRALEANGPRTIILAVTAFCTLEDRALCLNAGMDAFVGKPLTPQKLRRVLTAAGRRHLAAASMHLSPEAPSAGVDVSLLEYLSDGTDQGLNRQIELFLAALGEAEKQLERAAQTTDFKLLGDAAHGVLSHARLVGSASLATAAAGLQDAALAKDQEAFSSHLARARREIESLTAIVRRHPGAERTA